MKNKKENRKQTKRKTEKYRVFKKADEKGLFLSHHKNS